MAKRVVIAVLAMVFVLGACSSSGSDSSSGDDGGTTTTASGGDGGSSGGSTGDCGSMDGQTGVVRSFCDGPAKMTFTIGDTKGEIGGGTCESDAGYYVLNAGTVVSLDFSGTKPDYAGFLLPTKAGDFSGQDATVTITYDGTAHIVNDVTGTRDDTSGTFEGTDLDSGQTVSGSWTC